MKELKKEGDMIKQIVKSKIQDAELMMVCGRKITYKTMTTQDHMVKGSSYRKLAIGK